MPTPISTAETTAKPPAAKASPSRAGIAAAAALYALAELLAALLVGGFFGWGRAEALLFFAFRPWLLLVASLLVAIWRLPQRLLFYALAMLLAASSESLLLLATGAEAPWLEALRGIAGAALLLIVIDPVLQLGWRLRGRIGRSVATAFLALLMILPGALRPYEWIVLDRGIASPAPQRPDLMMLTALPLMWGESGPLDPASRPAAAFIQLEREFRVRPLDVLDASSLGSGKLLFLAQPRALAPAELAALDTWVQGGGRALILTDPMLLWPSELPFGDFRRPPAIGLLGPLLTHWGVRMDAPGENRITVAAAEIGGRQRRLFLFAPGSMRASGSACRVGKDGHVADCRIGAGRAVILADADMLHERLWAGDGVDGAERHLRLSDNAVAMADWLDALAGMNRPRLARDVSWADPAANKLLALLLACLPLVPAATPWALGRVRRRR